jgi:peptidoglycan hydrolase-like protein with peptidoglycan-binding domain
MRLQTRLAVLFAAFVLATASLAGVSTAALDDEETVAFDTPGESIPAPQVAPAPAPDPPAPIADPAPAPAAPAFPLTGPVFGQGSRGPEVELLQRRLIDLHYDPGTPDGGFGQATQYAVYAFQKINGIPTTGRIGNADRAALNNPFVPGPQRPDRGPDRVVINLPYQLLYLYTGGNLVLISHISSGNGEHYCVAQYNECRVAITPVGDFNFGWYHAGWDHGPLGDLWNPLYFTSAGHAVHGSQSVPLYPASHGCVRIPMHTADRFPTIVGIGWPVSVVG